MPKIIDADELSIEALLDNSKNVYIVPSHQRQFEWTKEQWSDLWDDIKLGSIEDSHFLGSIVVIPSDRPKVGINYFEINDGQQRMTTILILLSAIRDYAQKTGSDGLAKYISDKYLFSNHFEGGSQKDILKMKLGKLDNEQFEKVLSGKLQNGPTDEKHRIFECYNYFISRMSGYGPEELEDLKNRVVDKIIIVHINVANKLSAFRLFETLNDRGLPLSAVDLIKNYLLMRASSAGNDNDMDSIVEEWVEMYGKIRDWDPVLFFYRFMLSEYPGKISAKQLYEEIAEKAKNWGINEITEFSRKLNQAATVYSELMNANIGLQEKNTKAEVDRRLSDIKIFEAAPSYTLLLKVTPFLSSGEITKEQYLKIIDLIETFHIRWGICGQSTSRLNDIYNQMCAKISNTSPDKILEVVENEFLASASAINDSAFIDGFQQDFAQFSASRTKYIIWKLGMPKGEISLNFDEIHTEHILPQTLSREWMLKLQEETKMDKEWVKNEHDMLINKIGNFALIKGEWNISMSNKLFSDKKLQYAESEISLTNNLSKKDDWNFSEIRQRTIDFSTDAALKVWKFDKPIPENKIEVRVKRQKSVIEDGVDIYCKGPFSSASGIIVNGGMIRVCKGSTARKEAVPSLKDHPYNKLREELILSHVLAPEGNSLVFMQDYDFDSLSAAGSIVLGTSSNGWEGWKDKDNTPVSEIMGASGKNNLDGENYSEFYNSLINKIEPLLPREYRKPRSGNYYQIPTNVSKAHFEWVFRKNSFGVELHFESNDRDFNKEVVEKLESIKGLKEKLEKSLGEEVIFEKDRKWTKICVENKNTQMTDELKDWAVNKMKILIDILEPELNKIKSSGRKF